MKVHSQSKTELADRALKALRRAAKNALKLARQTGTPCYVMERDKIVDIAERGRAKAKTKKKRLSA
jgi:diaminopimelate decarboxylase